MPKYRCPVCGATHREMPDFCRLCGQQMGEEVSVGDFKGARTVVVQKKGLGGIMFMAIGLVVLIAVGLAVLGIGPGGTQIDKLTSKLPGVSRPTGWTELRDEDGKFVVNFPSNGRKQNKDATNPITGEKGTSWSVLLSEETLITVTYAKTAGAGTTTTTAAPAGSAAPRDPALVRIRGIGETYAEKLKTDSGLVSKRDDQNAFGFAAQYIEAANQTDPAIKNRVNLRSMFWIRDDTMYVIEVRSVYSIDKMTQFDNVLQSFQPL